MVDQATNGKAVCFCYLTYGSQTTNQMDSLRQIVMGQLGTLTRENPLLLLPANFQASIDTQPSFRKIETFSNILFMSQISYNMQCLGQYENSHFNILYHNHALTRSYHLIEIQFLINENVLVCAHPHTKTHPELEKNGIPCTRNCTHPHHTQNLVTQDEK